MSENPLLIVWFGFPRPDDLIRLIFGQIYRHIHPRIAVSEAVFNLPVFILGYGCFTPFASLMPSNRLTRPGGQLTAKIFIVVVGAMIPIMKMLTDCGRILSGENVCVWDFAPIVPVASQFEKPLDGIGFMRPQKDALDCQPPQNFGSDRRQSIYRASKFFSNECRIDHLSLRPVRLGIAIFAWDLGYASIGGLFEIDFLKGGKILNLQ